MTKSSGLVSVGWLFALFGAILMVISGFIIILDNIISEFENITGISLGFIPLDSNNQIFYGLVVILLGVIVLWIWKNKRIRKGDDLLLYGILFIIVGIISSLSLAGLLVVIGGALFLIEYFF